MGAGVVEAPKEPVLPCVGDSIPPHLLSMTLSGCRGVPGPTCARAGAGLGGHGEFQAPCPENTGVRGAGAKAGGGEPKRGCGVGLGQRGWRQLRSADVRPSWDPSPTRLRPQAPRVFPAPRRQRRPPGPSAVLPAPAARWGYFNTGRWRGAAAHSQLAEGRWRRRRDPARGLGRGFCGGTGGRPCRALWEPRPPRSPSRPLCSGTGERASESSPRPRCGSCRPDARPQARRAGLAAP